MARPLSVHAVSVLEFFSNAPATMADAAKALSLSVSVVMKMLVRFVESGRLRIVRRERMPHCKKPVCFYVASGVV
jgi:DNA-binding IclR family transcriptional regulator